MYAEGVVIVCDRAGFLNAARLKGIHSAIKSGMLAAETIFDALLEGDYSAKTLREFEHRVKRSWITPELRRYRNFHAGFRHGRWLGMANAGLQYITGGRAWGILERDRQEPGHEPMRKLSAYGYHGDNAPPPSQDFVFPGNLPFN